MNIVSIGIAAMGFSLLGWQSGGAVRSALSQEPAQGTTDTSVTGSIQAGEGQASTRSAARNWVELLMQEGRAGTKPGAKADTKTDGGAGSGELQDIEEDVLQDVTFENGAVHVEKVAVQDLKSRVAEELRSIEAQSRDLRVHLDRLLSDQAEIESKLRRDPDALLQANETAQRLRAAKAEIRSLSDKLASLDKDKAGLLSSLGSLFRQGARTGSLITKVETKGLTDNDALAALVETEVARLQERRVDPRQERLRELEQEIRRLQDQLALLKHVQAAGKGRNDEVQGRYEERLAEFLDRRRKLEAEAEAEARNVQAEAERLAAQKHTVEQQWLVQKQAMEKQWAAQQEAMKRKYFEQQRALDQQRSTTRQWPSRSGGAVGLPGNAPRTSRSGGAIGLPGAAPRASRSGTARGGDMTSLAGELRGIRSEIRELRLLLERYLQGGSRSGSTGVLPPATGGWRGPVHVEHLGLPGVPVRAARPERVELPLESIEEEVEEAQVEDPVRTPRPAGPRAPSPRRMPPPAGPAAPANPRESGPAAPANPIEPGPAAAPAEPVPSPRAPAPAPRAGRDPAPLMPVEQRFRGLGGPLRNS